MKKTAVHKTAKGKRRVVAPMCIAWSHLAEAKEMPGVEVRQAVRR